MHKTPEQVASEAMDVPGHDGTYPPISPRYVGCDDDLEEATRRWQETIKWRRRERVDGVLDEAFPHFAALKENLPTYYVKAKRQSDGRMICMYIEQPGRVNGAAIKDFKRQGLTPEIVERCVCVAPPLEKTPKTTPHSPPPLPRAQILHPQRRVAVARGRPDGRRADRERLRPARPQAGHSDGRHYGNYEAVCCHVRAAVPLLYCAARTPSSPLLPATASRYNSYYPERSGVIFILHAPMWFNFLWKFISTFASERTRQKVKVRRGLSTFRDDLRAHVDPADLPALYGGDSRDDIGDTPVERAYIEHITANNARHAAAAGNGAAAAVAVAVAVETKPCAAAATAAVAEAAAALPAPAAAATPAAPAAAALPPTPAAPDYEVAFSAGPLGLRFRRAPATGDVLVSRVYGGGQAEREGVAKGDLMAALAGRPVPDTDAALVDAIADAPRPLAVRFSRPGFRAWRAAAAVALALLFWALAAWALRREALAVAAAACVRSRAKTCGVGV